MAANLDRAETSLTAVSDIAYIRGIDGSGNSVRISKADLANVLGGLTFKNVLDAGVDIKQVARGIYGVNGQLIDAPSGTGASMLVVAVVGFIRLEVIFNRIGGHVYFRFKWGDAGYESWMTL